MTLSTAGAGKASLAKNSGKAAVNSKSGPSGPNVTGKPSKSFKDEDLANVMKTITKFAASAAKSAEKTTKAAKVENVSSEKKSGTQVTAAKTVNKSSKPYKTNGAVVVKNPSLKIAAVKKNEKLSVVAKNASVSKIEKCTGSWWVDYNSNPGQLLLPISAEESWYSENDNAQPLRTLERVTRLTVDVSKLAVISSAVEAAYEAEVLLYQKAKGSKMSGDQKWISDVLKSGTISDKVAALALVVQESPVHELSALDTLIGLASKKEYRTSQLALEAVKDLLLHNLLPDRRLVPFRSQPFAHPDMTMQHAMLFWYEEQLLQRMELVINALDVGLKSTIEYFKKQCMDIAAELLMGKPEKEGRFLAMVVNKLGDPSGAVGSKCIELLRNVVRKHPAMKCVVVREVRQLIYRPNLGVRVVHSGIVFLSQVILVKGDHDVAAQLVECYMSLFEKAVTQDELGSRLLSSLLSGLDRAFPFLNNKEPIAKHVDSLFRIIHSASFSTSTRALMLISHIALSDTDADAAQRLSAAGKVVNAVSDVETHLVSRFYRSLYSKLLSPQISTRAYNTLFLNLLFRSIKRDPSDLRVMAFLKRLGMCALQSSAPIAAGLLFLISEVYRARPNLLVMMTDEETLVSHKVYHDAKKGSKNDSDDEGEDSSASHQLGNFEASKREPAFAVTSTPALWEASLLRNHFHPSVRSFSSSVLEAPHVITFAGDPTTEFSLTAFLNRFAYKNPKKQHSDKIRRPQAMGEEPLNTASFLRSALSEIAPDKIFFHKFFGEKEKLRNEGKSRDRSKRRQNDDSDAEGDDASVGSDDEEVNFDEKAIDKFATKLAEDMLRDNDDLVDIDDDFSDSDGGDDSDGGSEDGEDFNMGGSDEEEESSAVDFEDFKLEKSKKDASKGKGKDGSAKKLVADDESDDGYELTAYGDDDNDDMDDDDDINSNSDMDDEDEDEDDLALAFSDDMPSSKRQKDAKKPKGRKPSGDMSDFASADDYEDQMEEIVGRYSGRVAEGAKEDSIGGDAKGTGAKRKVGGGGSASTKSSFGNSLSQNAKSKKLRTK